MATVTVDQNTSYQTFLGWESTAQNGYLEFPASYPNWDTETLDAIADLGITKIRTEILSGLVENSTDYYQLFLDDGVDKVNNTTPTSWANVRNNRTVPVNDNGDSNSINSSGFQWSMLDRQINEVIIPLKSRIEANGETLRWSVCYVHFSTSNQLHVNTPAEYGELILAVWEHVNSTFGFVPDSLEVYLEPDNPNCQVTPSELAAMIQYARDRLVNAGFQKPYIIAPSMTYGGDTEQYAIDIETANATAYSYIDELSYHRYDPAPTTGELSSLRTKALADGKNTAMLEYIGADMFDLYEDLRYARCSSWQQYTMAYLLSEAGSDNGGQYFLIGGSPTYAVTMAERTKYLRHFIKYIRPNAVMKGVTNSSVNYEGVVFQNPNGTYVVVVKCNGAGDIDIVGLPAGTYEIRYTLGNGTSAPSSYDQAFSNQTITEGQDVSFSMAGQGVVTIFNTNYMNYQSYNSHMTGNINISGLVSFN